MFDQRFWPIYIYINKVLSIFLCLKPEINICCVGLGYFPHLLDVLKIDILNITLNQNERPSFCRAGFSQKQKLTLIFISYHYQMRLKRLSWEDSGHIAQPYYRASFLDTRPNLLVIVWQTIARRCLLGNLINYLLIHLFLVGCFLVISFSGYCMV